jgi:hypothetical protein
MLHIEVIEEKLEDRPAEYSVKSVYDVPTANIRQWKAAMGQVKSLPYHAARDILGAYVASM